MALAHNGTTVRLKTRPPGGLVYMEDCDTLNTVFDDEGVPYVLGACSHEGCTQTHDPEACGGNLLSAFDGMPLDGDWYLYVQDYDAVDTGRVNSFSFCVEGVVPGAGGLRLPGAGLRLGNGEYSDPR